MLRLAVLIGVAAFVWFTLNDSPGVTMAVSSSPKVAVTSFPASAVISVAAAPEKTIVAQTTPERTVVAQAQTERSARLRQTRKSKTTTRISVYSVGSVRPNAVRRCVDWYAEERRPSGTVVVPHMRCQWVRR
jgi:hypothetical protein